jgi:hypothetical protein
VNTVVGSLGTLDKLDNALGGLERVPHFRLDAACSPPQKSSPS